MASSDERQRRAALADRGGLALGAAAGTTAGLGRETAIKLRGLIEILIPAVALLTVLGVIKLSWFRRMWARLQLALWIYVAIILILAVAFMARQILMTPP